MVKFSQVLIDSWFVLRETITHPLREAMFPSEQQNNSRKDIRLSSLRLEIGKNLKQEDRIKLLEDKVLELERNANSPKKLGSNFKLLLWFVFITAILSFSCSIFLSNQDNLNANQKDILEFCKVVYKSTFFSFLGLIGGKVVA